MTHSHDDLKTKNFHIDYILVYPINETVAQKEIYDVFRNSFQKAAEQVGLSIITEDHGGKTFTQISASFKCLMKQAEKSHLRVPLKNIKRLEEPQWLHSCFPRLFPKVEEDYVSAPVEFSRLQMFENSDNPEKFFRSSIRSILVHEILLNLDVRQFVPSVMMPNHEFPLNTRTGLPQLLIKGVYKDAFILHEMSINDPFIKTLRKRRPDEYREKVSQIESDPRRALQQKWLPLLKLQPLGLVRDYFGEKIALYFAWTGVYISMLWLPALAGLSVFAYGLHESLINESDLNNMSCDNANTSNSQSAQSCGHLQMLKLLAQQVLGRINDAFDNIATPFFSIVMCLWGVLLIKVWERKRNRLVYDWDSDNYRDTELDRPEFWGTRYEQMFGDLEPIFPGYKKVIRQLASAVAVLAMISLVGVSVSSIILLKVTLRVKMNCPLTGSDGQTHNNASATTSATVCLLLTIVLPTLLNAISIILLSKLYRFIARKLTDWENHRTQSEYHDAMILKLFAFQFANSYMSLIYIAFFRSESNGFQTNGVFGLGPEYKDTCVAGECMSLLSFQVLILMLTKPFPKFLADIVWPFFVKIYRSIKRQTRVNKLRENTVTDSSTVALVAFHKVDHQQSFLEREFNKPREMDFTLTEYMEKIIQHGYVIMFSASFPLAPFLALIVDLSDIKVDAKRLLWWNRRPLPVIASDIGTWLPIMYFLTLCGVVSNGFIIAYTSGFCERFLGDNDVSTSERLAVLIVFEHIVAGMLLLLFTLVPSVPTHILLARRKEKIFVSKLLEGRGISTASSFSSKKPIGYKF